MSERNGWMMSLCAVAIALALGAAGCSETDAVKAAKQIAAYTPTVEALVRDAVTLAEALDADSAATLEKVNTAVQADLQLVATASAAYAQAPSASGWTAVVQAVDTLVANTDSGLLEAEGIKSSESQLKAKAALAAVDAAVHVLDGYMQSAQPSSTTTSSATTSELRWTPERRTRRVKVEQVTRYWSAGDWRRVELALGADRGELMRRAWQIGL